MDNNSDDYIDLNSINDEERFLIRLVSLIISIDFLVIAEHKLFL
jgi:hypothetical protein